MKNWEQLELEDLKTHACVCVFPDFLRSFIHSLDYDQTLRVVVLIVVKMLGFFYHNSAPCRRIGTRIGGNESYKPPGAFETVQGP